MSASVPSASPTLVPSLLTLIPTSNASNPGIYDGPTYNSDGPDQLESDTMLPGVSAAVAFGILLCVVSACVVCWYMDTERAKIEHHDVEVRKASYEHWHKPEVIERSQSSQVVSEDCMNEAGEQEEKKPLRPDSFRKFPMQPRVSATPELPGDDARINNIPGADLDNPMHAI